MFRLHELHHYATDTTNENGGPPHYRAGEVKEYLESHPEIERFVIIDTECRLETDDEQRARQILSELPAQPNREWPPRYGPAQRSEFFPG